MLSPESRMVGVPPTPQDAPPPIVSQRIRPPDTQVLYHQSEGVKKLVHLTIYMFDMKK